jgi:hypothetical protein
MDIFHHDLPHQSGDVADVTLHRRGQFVQPGNLEQLVSRLLGNLNYFNHFLRFFNDFSGEKMVE